MEQLNFLFYLVFVINLFTFVSVQESTCIFKNCFCYDHTIDCTDSELYTRGYFTIKRNIKMLSKPGNLSLNVYLSNKSDKFFIQDFTFANLNFNLIYIHAYFEGTSVSISTQAFKNVGFIKKLTFDSITYINIKPNQINPFEDLKYKIEELNFIKIDFAKHANYLKILQTLKDSLNRVSLVDSVEFIPDLRFLKNLTELSIVKCPIRNTSVYQIRFKPDDYKKVDIAPYLPLNLQQLEMTSIYTDVYNEDGVSLTDNLNNFKNLSLIAPFISINKTKSSLNNEFNISIDAYDSYLNRIEWIYDANTPNETGHSIFESILKYTIIVTSTTTTTLTKKTATNGME